MAISPTLAVKGRNITKVVASGCGRVYALDGKGQLFVTSEPLAAASDSNTTTGGSSLSVVKCSAVGSKGSARPDTTFVDVSAGALHAVVVGKSGRVYSIGEQGCSNHAGELGWGFRYLPPLSSLPSSGLPAVRAGAHTSEGGIAECVVEGYDSTFKEVAVPLLANPGAVAVACGRNHTLFCTEGGNVYAFGSNVYSQLGTGTIRKKFDPDDVSRCR
jgi:alpha-tubulin suppressor-like RCC1 family protein